MTGRLTTAMENDTPTFHDLSPKDQATAAKVVRGEVTTDNPKINQAAQELQDHFKNVLQAARAAGIDAGDLGEKYIPQMKEAGYFDKASNIKKLIKTLVGKGYSEEQATQTVNRLRNDVRSRPNLAGHLDYREKLMTLTKTLIPLNFVPTMSRRLLVLLRLSTMALTTKRLLNCMVRQHRTVRMSTKSSKLPRIICTLKQ